MCSDGVTGAKSSCCESCRRHSPIVRVEVCWLRSILRGGDSQHLMHSASGNLVARQRHASDGREAFRSNPIDHCTIDSSAEGVMVAATQSEVLCNRCLRSEHLSSRLSPCAGCIKLGDRHVGHNELCSSAQAHYLFSFSETKLLNLALTKKKCRSTIDNFFLSISISN